MGSRIVHIDSKRRSPLPAFRELLESTQLIYYLVLRDLKVRYQQTTLGVLWAIIQPITATLVFSIIFGRLSKLESEGEPYVVFAMLGMVPWTFFAAAVTGASNSIFNNANLVRKVYFSRLVLPVSAVLGMCIDYVLATLVCFPILLYYSRLPTLAVVALPIVMMVVVVTAIAFGLVFAALVTRFRDLRHVVSLVLQLWLFSTPVVYSIQVLPVAWRGLLASNPMVGCVELTRWALLPDRPFPTLPVVVGLAVISVVLVFGVVLFNRLEENLVDVL